MQTVFRSPNLRLKRRMEWAFLLFLLVFAALAARLAWVQWWQHAALTRLATAVHVRRIPVPARRGEILDRNGRELASNILAIDVCANPRVVADAEATARALVELYGGEVDEYRRKLARVRKTAFVYLKRGVEREVAERSRQELKRRVELKGIELRLAPSRIYPGDSLAAAVLGYVNIDQQGIEGLELQFDRVLAGKDGYIVAEVDARQEVIPATERQAVAPVDGKSIVLTLDATVQQFAEHELQKAVEQWHPESASVIVMDVRSGEVLALANTPGYNANKREAVPPEYRRCRAITDVYEPGSTFKVITAAAALEERINTDTYCSGGKVVGVHTIRCAKHRAHGQCDIGRTIEQSCNIAAGTWAERLGPERIYNTIKAFGFLERTGIELAGETVGWMGKWEEWRPIRTFNVGFGQGIAVTPIQLLRAFAAVANDGQLVRPRMVLKVGDDAAKAYEPARRVMTVENARDLRGLMERVVTTGTGKNAKIAHYSAAGKTGTAQIARNGVYVGGAYVGSFLGFVPADEPKIAMLVLVRHPKGAHYGGTVAAPIFREVSRQVMNYLQIPPDAPGDERDGTNIATFERWKRRHGVQANGGERDSAAD